MLLGLQQVVNDDRSWPETGLAPTGVWEISAGNVEVRTSGCVSKYVSYLYDHSIFFPKKSEIRPTMEVGGWVQVSLGFFLGEIVPK